MARKQDQCVAECALIPPVASPDTAEESACEFAQVFHPQQRFETLYKKVGWENTDTVKKLNTINTALYETTSFTT